MYPASFFPYFLVQTWLLDPNCPFALGTPDLWKPKDMAVLCEALTRHGRHMYDQIVHVIGEHVATHIEYYKPAELVTCMRGFQRANLAFPQTALVVAKRIGKELQLAVATCAPLELLTISRLCFFIESLSHFGYNHEIIESAVRLTCQYLTNRIDSVTERSAIRVCWAIALYGLFCEYWNPILVSFNVLIQLNTALSSYHIDCCCCEAEDLFEPATLPVFHTLCEAHGHMNNDHTVTQVILFARINHSHTGVVLSS